MPNFSDHVADKFVGHTIRLTRYSSGVARKVLGLLLELEEEVADEIHRFDIAGVSRETYKRGRAEALLKQLRGTIATAYGKVHKTTQAELLELSDLEKTRVVRTLNKGIGASVWTTSSTRGELRQLVSNVLIQGSPAREWWAKQSRDLRSRFASQVRLGMAAGETNDQIVQRIRGQRTGAKRAVVVGKKVRLVPTYSGGTFDGSKREAQALVRTAVHTVSNQTIRKVYEENEDLLRGVGLMVTLDNRTTLTCIGLSGGKWDMEGNPLPDSEVQKPYPGEPPYHWNCRTVPYPITKTWDELIEEKTGTRLKKELDTVPDDVRASMDGEVAGNWNYEDWLKSKSAAEQREILGAGRYKMWKSGKLALSDLVGQDNRPLTIKELEAML